MRIIGGKNQRKHITAPVKLPVRPTTDMAKEALFNILNNHLDFEEVAILDLFAGTGNISYEFASRGAKEIIAVDINNDCVQFIKKTALTLSMGNLKAVRAEAMHFIGLCKVSFDIVFADPPYDYPSISDIPEKVFSAMLVKPGGWLIVEHGEKNDLAHLDHFFEKRKYGKVHFSFFYLPE